MKDDAANLPAYSEALSSSSDIPHVIIIGGGITGLATAYYLQKEAQTFGRPLRYTLLERGPVLGGKIVSQHVDGFLVEGGPDSFLTGKPWALTLCRELGLDKELIGPNEAKRQTYVFNRQRLHPLPEGLMLIVPTRFRPFISSSLISIPGKLRMGMDLFIPRRTDSGDETLGSFVRRRLGQEAVDKIAAPLLSGIYVSDPERLSLQSTFPRLLEVEKKHGSLIRGMLAARWAVKHHDGKAKEPMFMTLRGGMQQLVDTLADELSGTVQTGCQVVFLDRPNNNEGPPYRVYTRDGQVLRADAIVLATPANVSSLLLAQMAPTLALSLRKIRYVSTAVVSLGYQPQKNLSPLNGFGFLIPKSENRRIAACTWSSTKFDYRAPENHQLLRCFVSRPEIVSLDDESLLQVVREELKEMMGLEATPDLVRIFRWHQATPQYDLGHLERVKQMQTQAEAFKGLVLTGSSYEGVGVPDCVRQAKQAALKVFSYFGG